MQPDELDELVEKLEYVSTLNGYMTEDEKSLLNVVKENVDKFKEVYALSIEDGGFVSESDKEQLRELWKNILLETSKKAIEDQIITKDELRIIFNIFTVVIKHMN